MLLSLEADAPWGSPRQTGATLAEASCGGPQPNLLGGLDAEAPDRALQAPSFDQALQLLMALESLRPERHSVGGGHGDGGGEMAENIALFANYV